MHEPAGFNKETSRREGPDPIARAVNVLTAVAWLIILGILIALAVAKPQFKGFHDGVQTLKGRWDMETLDMILYLLVIQVFICGLGLSFNAFRLKRKGDRLSPSLIFLAGASIFGILIYSIML